MNPIYETIRFYDSLGLSVRRHVVPNFTYPWHLHPEFELTLIVKGPGKRFVGDHVESYENGDIVLVGGNLPHVWLSDRSEWSPENEEIHEAVVIHFGEEFLCSHLLETNEFDRIATVLDASSRGLKLIGETREDVTRKIVKLESATGLQRFIGLIEILDRIGETGEYELLASNQGKITLEKSKSARIRRVDEFLMQNYNRDISVSDVAKVAHMNTSAFCRFFKKETLMTFSQYLIELRISYACKLLISDNKPISWICYECGFNSLSYFNRKFREIMKMTPKKYRVKFGIS